MKTSILSLIALVVMVFESPAAGPYPIDPRPLRRLVLESKYIVSGTVKEIKSIERKRKEETYTSQYVVIVIKEVLQGAIAEAEIHVSYNPNVICPAPARYHVGTKVVAFLNKGEDMYITTARSYGAKTVSDEGLESYTARIREIQKINTAPEGLDKFMATVEWLVTCAEHKETRWEGTYELSPQSDFMSFYSRTEHQPFAAMLSPDQKLRLKNALLREPEMDYDDFGLADLVYVGNEKEIHAFMLNAFKKLRGNADYYATSFMERLKLLTNDPQLDTLIVKYDAILFKEKKEDERKQIIDQFVAVVENRK